MDKEIGIYFHTPYCKLRCKFCAFYVLPGAQKRVEEYFSALKKELNLYSLSDYNISTIYAGGGTPSAVNSDYICNFISYIKSNYKVNKNAEITVEASPETLTKESLENYLKAGVNRLSIGLQAWQDDILKYLGRGHTLELFLEKYNLARSVGFTNINIDLIYGIPNQTLENWKDTLHNVVNLNPNHISAYSLIIDEESTFGILYRLGKLKPVSETLDRKMYMYAKQTLEDNGYNQYELSNYARKGYECVHNSSQWKDNDFIGLGASAHTRFNKFHYDNISSIEKYIQKINSNEFAYSEIEKYSKKDQIVEHILLKLRLNSGIDFNEFKDKFNLDFLNEYKEQIKALLNKKLIEIDSNSLRLTLKGQHVENIVGLEFV